MSEVCDFWEHWKLVRYLNDGASAEVFLVVSKTDPSLKMTLKCFGVQNSRPEVEAYQELKKLSLIRHCEVINKLTHPHNEERECTALLLEYHKGPDVQEWCNRNRHSYQLRKDCKFLWSFLRSIVNRLSELHAQGITHADIKPENIILTQGANGDLTSDVRAELIDYGFSQSSSKSPRQLFVGTFGFTAPEWLPGKMNPLLPLAQPADIYSLGSLMVDIVTGDPAYDASSSKEGEIEFQDLTQVDFGKDENLKNLVISMLELCPEARPSIFAIQSKLINFF